jgi:hypothetical protein
MAVFAIKGYVAQEVIDLCSSDFGILEHIFVRDLIISRAIILL